MSGKDLDKRADEVGKKLYYAARDALLFYMDYLRENNCKKCRYREKCSEQVRALEAARLTMQAFLNALPDVVYNEYGVPDGVIEDWLFSYLDKLILRRNLVLCSKLDAGNDVDYGIYG